MQWLRKHSDVIGFGLFVLILLVAGLSMNRYEVKAGGFGSVLPLEGSLTFIKSASPSDGTDFTFDLSGPTNPTLIAKWGSFGSGLDQFKYPYDISLSQNGEHLFIADSDNHRVQKYDKEGSYLASWGESGTGNLQFNKPRGIAVNTSGIIYVADTDNHRIQKLSSSGAFLGKWGGKGTSNGKFDTPTSLALDAAGNLYVADRNNHRVQKFDKDGVFLGKFGSEGSGNGQFIIPKGIVFDKQGDVYVVDQSNARVQKFDKDGNFLRKWGSEGSADGQFLKPTEIALDTAGHVYITDSNNHRIQKFDQDGKFLAKWGSEGSGDGQFDRPKGIAIDQTGTIYIVDRFNHRIQKFLASTFVLDDAQPDDGDDVSESVTYENIPIGLYTAGERLEGEWELDNLTCSGALYSQVTVDNSDREVTIDLAVDEHVICTFVNKLPPPSSSLTFVKSASPSDGTDFTFDLSGLADPTTFVLDDAQPDDGDDVKESVTYENIPAGQYTATERLNGKWELESLTCSGAEDSQVNVDKAKRKVTIDLTRDEHVTCTFANKLPPPTTSLTFVKSASPSDGTDFTFDLTGPSNNTTFVLDDAQPDDGDNVSQSVTYKNIPTGQYTATERLNGEWELESLTCSGAEDSQVTVDKNNRKVTVDLVEDEQVTCTFANKLTTLNNSMTFIKSTIPSTGADFTFDLTGPAGDSSFVLDDAQPDDGDDVSESVTYENSPTGQYTVTERLRGGWEMVSVSCTSSNNSQATVDVYLRTASFELAEDEDVTCTFASKLVMALPLLISP